MSAIPPPILTGSSITGTAAEMTISLDFNEAMALGGGTIMVTDGALQTVIDRSTGLPTQRIVGATDTHEIPLSMISIDGGHVTISAQGLTPGHQYRVLIGLDALESSGKAFAGVSSNLLAFTTPAVVDATPPTVSAIVITGASPVLSTGATVTVTFSEKVTLSDTAPAIVAPHASLANLHTTDGGITWVANLVPDSATTASGNQLYVDLGQVRDSAGNAGTGTAAASSSYIVDTQGAVFKDLSLNGAILNQTRTIELTIHMKNAVSSFDVAAIKAPNATVENLHSDDNGLTWIATLRPKAGVSVNNNTLGIDMTKVLDANGVAGSGLVETTHAYGVDTVAPTATLTLAGTRVSGRDSVTVSIAFSEAMQSLDPAAIKAPHATVTDVSSADGGLTWTARLAPTTTSESVSGNSVALDMTMVRDIAGNKGTGTVSSTTTYAVDIVAPTATIALSGDRVTQKGTVDATITFSEAVGDLDASYFSSPNAKVSALTTTDHVTWHATLSSNANVKAIENVFSLDMTKVKDAFGNAGAGTATSSASYDVDTTSPTATLSLDGTHLTASQGVTLTIHFSEAVSALDASSFSTPHAQLSDLRSTDDGITWTATLTGSGTESSSDNLVTLDMTKVQDLFGNAGSGSAAPDTGYDVDIEIAPPPPAATFSFDHPQLQYGGSIAVTIVFATAVPALSADALSAPYATVSDLSTDDGGTTWHLVLAAHETGIDAASNVLTIDMSKVMDASEHAGTGSVASPAYSVDTTVATYVDEFRLVDDTGSSMSDFVTSDPKATFEGYLSAGLSGGQHVELKIDGTAVDVSEYGSGWQYAPTLAPTLADGEHVISIRVVDGDHASAEVTRTFTIDTHGPEIVSPADEASQDVGQALVITFDEPVSWHAVVLTDEMDEPTWRPIDNFVQLVTGDSTDWVYIDARNLSEDGKTLTIAADDLHLAAGSDYQLYLPAALTDKAGNPATHRGIPIRTSGAYVDSSAPEIVAAHVLNQVGPYGIGAQIRIALQFNEPVKTAGDFAALVLPLNNGATANYSDISSDGRTLYFVYTVAESDRATTDQAGGFLDASGLGNLPGAVTDLAGNALAAAPLSLYSLYDYVSGSGIAIDTVLPAQLAAPLLDLDSNSGDKGDAITNAGGITLHGTGATANSMVLLYDVAGDGAILVGRTWSDESGAWEFAGTELAEGSHQLSAVQINMVENASIPSPALSIVVDRHAAAVGATLDTDSGTTGDWVTSMTTPTLTGSGAETGATVEVLEGATVIASATATGSEGNWSIVLPVLSEGLHGLEIRQTDVAGNVSDSTIQTLDIDTTAPEKLLAPVLDEGSDSGTSHIDGITNVTRPVFTGAGAEAGATIELWEGTSLLASGRADENGAWSLAPGTALVEGDHAITARQVDAAGNAGAKSDALSVTIDITAPVVAGWTANLLFGSRFEIWFSEPVVHSGSTGSAIMHGASDLSMALGDDSYWTDNVMRDGHATSVFSFVPLVSGTVDLPLSELQDKAGNHIVGTVGHYNVTVDLSGTSWYPGPHLIL